MLWQYRHSTAVLQMMSKHTQKNVFNFFQKSYQGSSIAILKLLYV